MNEQQTTKQTTSKTSLLLIVVVLSLPSGEPIKLNKNNYPRGFGFISFIEQLFFTVSQVFWGFQKRRPFICFTKPPTVTVGFAPFLVLPCVSCFSRNQPKKKQLKNNSWIRVCCSKTSRTRESSGCLILFFFLLRKN